MKEQQERIKKYNEIFDEYKNQYDKTEKSFRTIQGKIPVLISAPHSVRQLRNGKIKGKDLYTGPIVMEIANQTQCYAIYKIFNNQDDANYDIENNEYKEKVLEIIKQRDIQLFIDIHGASDNDEFDIDIGTDDYKNLNEKKEVLEKFIQLCNKNGIYKIGIDKKFKANTLHTITKTVAINTKIPCMQIELTRKYRSIEDFEKMRKIIDIIVELIKDF